jgi:hypothetical protein
VEILSRQFQITQKFEKSTIPFPLEGQGSSVNIHMAPKLESLKNLPTECKSLVIFDCPKIKTFRDLPEKVELLSIMLHDHQVLDHLPEGLSDSLDLTLSDLSQIRCKIPNSVERLFLHGLHSCRGICEKFDNPKSLELFINIDGRDKEGCRDILRIKNLKKICPSDHSQVSPDIYKTINAQLSKPTQ